MRRLVTLSSVCALLLSGQAIASPNSAGVQCKAIKDKAKRLQCFDAIDFNVSKKEPELAPEKSKSWTNEPSAFLSMTLGEKIESSIPQQCPSRSASYGGDEFDKYAWEKQGKPLCRSLRAKGGELNGVKYPRWYEVWGSGVEELRRGVRVETDNEERVNRIKGVFYSSEGSALYSALVQRFGEPSETTPSAMRLNNGASIPGTTSVWLGKNAILRFSSHASREVDRGISDFGEISFTSTAFIDRQLKEQAADDAKKAAKF
jgi:hypothetical protein